MNTFLDFSTSDAMRHYSLHETLGAGNFAKVKLGTHLLTQEPVAVKIISHGKTGGLNDTPRINREVSIMRKLDNPYVVQLYDVSARQVIEDTGKTFLVMEYLQGGDLLNYIVTQQRLPESEACRLFQQLVSGVGYLHGLGVAHRDLKPANLLLTANKDLKIADFGLSSESSIESLETRCGSPCFTSPEIISGMPYDGRKVDVWGLGIVLYIMLVGRLPFEDDNKASLFRKICLGKFNVPAYLSNRARDLLKRLLTVDAKDRATLADIRRHPWMELAERTRSRDKPRHAIDYSAFTEAQALGFSHKELLEGLEQNLKNAATATYHLLHKRRVQEDTIELLSTNRSQLRRSVTPLLVRNRRNTSVRPTPEPVSPISPQRSPKPLDRKETLLLHRMTPLRPISQCRGLTRRCLPDSQRPTIGILRRRIFRDPIAA